MFNKRSFGGGGGASKSELSNQMLEILHQVEEGVPDIREAVIAGLDALELEPTNRDITAAWEVVKKKAVSKYSRKFALDERKDLVWRSGTDEAPKRARDSKISARNVKKLNDMARQAGCSVDEMVEKLIDSYRS